ncbi:hypothetical protein FGO68_gene498 [Halteria grandinella]|uniref:Origin recognition complex subunit 2 n=1 Tax=Halteria grandinella TaxID=5974 RepID=A0A8J8NNF4_HALGN|nr:hypothetical protein FGO68_gene498 [Halteria grandinella]
MEIENEIGGTGGRVGVGDSKARGEKKGSHFIVATGKDYSGKGVQQSFVNYFVATRNRDKVTDADEDKGKKLLLRTQDQQKPKATKERDGVTAQVKQDDFVIEKEEDDLRKHRLEKEALQTFNLERYGGMMKHYINCGFNLLIYGVGSKWDFLNNFAKRYLGEHHRLVINGFHSATSMKSITNQMVTYAQKNNLKYAAVKKTTMSLNDQIENIKQVFRNISEPENGEAYKKNYVLLIHSLDIGALKNDEFQQQIAEIAEIPYVSLIVSVDHIKAGMMWSEQMIDRFNFMALQVNTFADYDVEQEYQSPLFSFKNDNQEVGLSFVLKSMTQTQRNILKLIAKYQLDNPQDKGIQMKELMNLCVENMLAFSQKAIKDYLHEAKDHKVIHERTDENGHQILFMTYNPVLLEKISNDELN